MWSFALWIGALIIGFPISLNVVSHVSGFWKRTAILTIAGALVIFLLGIVVLGPYAIFAPPSGGIMALSCCLLNYDRLKKDQFEFMGRLRGIGV